MTFEDLLALPEYSCTNPTGTTIGKRWRRHEPYRRSAECCKEHDCGHWFIGEYVTHPEPGMVGIRWSKFIAETTEEDRFQRGAE